jgi:hypothetical protein
MNPILNFLKKQALENRATYLKSSENKRAVKTDEVRTRDVFAFLPIWTEERVVWLKRVSITERLYTIQYKEFSEWNYNFFWDHPKGEWIVESINEKK